MISVSSTLFNPTEKLKIQLSVGLNNDEYKNLVSIYENAKGVYISITPNIVVKMSFVQQNRKWERSDVIYIHERNIYMLNMGLDEFYKKLMVPDRFIYDDKGYVAEINSDNGNECVCIQLTKGQYLQIEPAILYDKQGFPLPGVMLRINMKSNEVDLSLDEFEAMKYMFQNIQIHQEGMLLLQTYLLMRKNKMEIPHKPDDKSSQNKLVKYRKSIFDRSSNDEEYVKTPVTTKPQDNFINPPETIE